MLVMQRMALCCMTLVLEQQHFLFALSFVKVDVKAGSFEVF